MSNNELLIFRVSEAILYNSKTINLPQYNLIYKIYVKNGLEWSMFDLFLPDIIIFSLEDRIKHQNAAVAANNIAKIAHTQVRNPKTDTVQRMNASIYIFPLSPNKIGKEYVCM